MVLNITLKTLDSQNYQFDADDDWTVQQFKEHIKDTINVLPNEQRLIFCGRVLQDDKKLTEYDCNGKVVHLVRRPPPSLNNNPNDDPEPNNSDGMENIRYVDDNNVLFSAMTLGPEANVQNIVRQIVTLQQAIVTRTLSDGTYVSSTIEPMSMTDIDRHLHNASRLLRITANTINECMARIAASPTTNVGTEGVNLEQTRRVITTASSHTDLQVNNDNLRSSSTNLPTLSQTQAAPSATVDDMNLDSASSDNISAQRQSARSSLTRHSLTTDDLPQSNRPVQRIIPVILPIRTSGQDNHSNSTSRNRQRVGTELDRYLEILNYSCDLQNQAQGLNRRYRQLIDLSRRGGLIVPRRQQTSTSNNDDNNTNSSSSESTSVGNQPSEQSSNNNSTSINSAAALNTEARILSSYIPRIMHHLSHLLHAMSDFSVDFATGRLLLSNPSNSRTRIRHQTARRSNPSESYNQRGSTPRAFARRSVPFVPIRPPAPNSQPQPHGTHINSSQFTGPTSYPLNNPNDPHTQQQRAPPENQPHSSTTTNSTQTLHRPIGVISGRIPLPFDYFLPCYSPWASMAYNVSNRQANVPDTLSATIQIEAINPNDRTSSNTSGSGPASQSINQNPGNLPNQESSSETTNTSILDGGLTDVVNNIVGSIFRSPQSGQQASTGSSGVTPRANQIPHDPIIDMIPQLALNAVNQILGGVFSAPVNQQQSNSNTNEQNINRNNQQTTTPNAVMMDIDIDDSSSSQSESRYQDARESSPTVAALNLNTQCSSGQLLATQQLQQQTNAPQPGHSRDNTTPTNVDRRKLAEVMQNHSEWIPIIEADINIMNQQHQQQTFSDAYLSSIPRKRRRLLTASPDRVPILQPSPSQAISNILRRAITNSNTSNVDSLEQVLISISSDQELQSAYDDYIRSAVEARLKTDYDYSPQKFQNSSKYFK